MAGADIPDDAVAAAQASVPFVVQHQDVALDFDFTTQTITGRATLTIEPRTKDLREIRLSARQLEVTAIRIDNKHKVDGFRYADPYHSVVPLERYSVLQHHLFARRSLDPRGAGISTAELVVPLPQGFRVQQMSGIILSVRADSRPAAAAVDLDEDNAQKFRSLTLTIEYVVRSHREGVHWVGFDGGDLRYPHVYSYADSLARTPACSWFPCVEAAGLRHTWRLSVKCPRTLGDVEYLAAKAREAAGEPVAKAVNGKHVVPGFSDEEKEMDLVVACSGFLEDNDAPDDDKAHSRKWVFNCQTPVLSRHVGFAIGPFEEVDLSEFRDRDQDDKMGQSAVSISGLCLPGRSDEVRNTCMPVASALDKFSTSYVFYPFESSSTSYSIVFVDDLPSNVVHTATVSICSSRLLVPANVIDPLNDSTREIVHAVASQWLGVKLVAKSARDSWIIIGGAYFMADQFMMGLWGKNEHRYRLKRAADKIHSMDVRRPSIYDMGAYVDLDPAEYEFLKLKATAIFHILHHRIIKAYGRNGVDRIMYRVLLDDNLGKIDGSEVDTDRLIRSTEKVAHFKVDTFFHQWVYGAGCPSFSATQKFNKKKLVVEILLKQTQASDLSPDLNENSFLRELKEREHAMKTPAAQPLFTGPMTIRIHEADGTPYEHIVDIKEVTTKIDIPYYTKYKRLKRNRRQKERAAAMTGIETNGEAQDDVLVYCLGDVLQSEDEVREWELEDWSKEDEEKMSNEHFEWIRVDKDFEWIAKIAFNQPHYMWVSQLQQDNDVVAQVESIDYLMGQVPHHLISTILTRTLMDSRYFYGIRVLAARALASNALAQLNWIGLKHLFKAFQALFCIEKTTMTRSNDFSNFASYYIQCAIVDAIAMVREPSGRSPEKVKRFFIEKLKFNDNSSNAYSDAFYVAKLMAAAVRTLVSTKPRSVAVEDYEQDVRDTETQRAAIEEVQRYRRMDEWIPSHQNIYTVTALDGMRLLMQNGIPGLKIADMMGYTRPGNSNFVRTKAFECLVDVGAFSNAHIMAFFIVSFYSERSPYMRDRIWDVICRAFGRMALAEPARQSQPHGGLVIDDADTSQHAQARTIGGASAMLRAKAGNETVLQGVIMEALRSPNVSLANIMDMLTLCRVLYPVTDHYILKIPLPQFWRAEHLGHGKMKFTKTGRFRTHPVTMFESRFKKPAITKGAKRTNPSDETGEANGEAKRPRLSAEGSEEKSHIISFKVRTPASVDPPPVVKQEAPPPVAQPTPPPAAPPPLTVETQLLPPAPAPVQISAPPSTAASTPRSKPQPRRTLIVILKASQAVLRRFAPAPAALPSPDVFSFPSSDSEATPLAAVAAAAKSKSKPAHGTAKAKHKFGKTGLSREGSSKSASGSPAPQQPVVVAAPPVVEKKSGFKIKLNLGKKG